MNTALAIVPRIKPPQAPAILVDPAAEQQAAARLEMIQPLLDFPQDPGRFASLTVDGVPITSLTLLVRWLSQKHGVGRTTLWRWVQSFRAGGFAALADGQRADKGRSRWAAKSDTHAQLAELAVYVRYRDELSIQEAWEKVAARAQRLGVEAPSYGTVRSWIEAVPAPVKTLALKGREAYDRAFAPHIARGYEDIEAGEILVSDHAIADVLVQNDLFDAKDHAHMRLRFTGLICMRSRKIVAYAWSQEGSSRSITTCIRMAVLRHGLFRTLYADNGKDFQKVGRGAESTCLWTAADLAPETLGVLARLGIGVKYCRKFAPQSKLIERFNGTYHQRFDKGWLTYTGSTPEQRPDKCIAALERHKKLLAAGRPNDSDLPLASEYIRAAALWIEGSYNERPKNVKGMKGLSPNEAFDKYRWTKQPPAPDPAELAPLLAERAECAVRRNAIMLDGVRYVAANEASSQELHDRTGGSIIVAYDADPMHRDSVAAIDAAGRVVAWLEPETLLRQSDDDETRSLIAASMEQRGRRYRETREQLDDLSRRVLSTGYIPHHEQLLQLGRTPIDISSLVVHRPRKTQTPKTQDTEQLAAPGEAADFLAGILRSRQ